MGQKWSSRPHNATSGLPRTNDVVRPHRHVSNVPLLEVTASFDHLIGAINERDGRLHAKHLRGFQIDEKLDLSGKLHGGVPRAFLRSGCVRRRCLRDNRSL